MVLVRECNDTVGVWYIYWECNLYRFEGEICSNESEDMSERDKKGVIQERNRGRGEVPIKLYKWAQLLIQHLHFLLLHEQRREQAENYMRWISAAGLKLLENFLSVEEKMRIQLERNNIQPTAILFFGRMRTWHFKLSVKKSLEYKCVQSWK